jgi:hypothetical protein
MYDGLHTRNGRKLVGKLFFYFDGYLRIIYRVCERTGRRKDAI